ncbi:flagellar motor switch protein FliG [Haliea atlantica]
MAEAQSGIGLSGPQRAAVFLLGVGEKSATEVMRYMEPREVQLIGEAMNSLTSLTNAQVESVMKEFHRQAANLNPLGLGATEFTRRVLTHALGESRARSMLSKFMPGDVISTGLDALRWMESSAVADLVRDEHPQIIATVLSTLEDDHAAQVLRQLPAELRQEILFRIARLEQIDPAALEELDGILESQLGKRQASPARPVDGKGSAAAILNRLDNQLESELLDALKQRDEALGSKVAELMFVFEDLLAMDDRSMQRLIREIAVDGLVIALKGVDEAVRQKFFANMSARAADMLREDIEAKGPVRLAEVESHQREILETARRLADEGEIMLGSGDEGFV